MRSKNARRAAIADRAADATGADDEDPHHEPAASLPVDRSGETVGQLRTGAVGEIPGPAGHVWPAIDDRHGHRPAAVPERDQGPTRQGPVRHAHERLRERLATRGPVAVQARAEPRDVPVVMPRVGADGPCPGGRLGRSNQSRQRLGSQVWFDDGRTLSQASGGPGPWILGRCRHRRPLRERSDLDSFEEVGVDGGGRAGDPRTDRTRDGDRGEDGDERHARDDPEASHVCGDPTMDPRFGVVSTPLVTKSEPWQHPC